jgi:hypothetical protein
MLFRGGGQAAARRRAPRRAAACPTRTLAALRSVVHICRETREARRASGAGETLTRFLFSLAAAAPLLFVLFLEKNSAHALPGST